MNKTTLKLQTKCSFYIDEGIQKLSTIYSEFGVTFSVCTHERAFTKIRSRWQGKSEQVLMAQKMLVTRKEERGARGVIQGRGLLLQIA